MNKSLESVQAMRLFEKGTQGAQVYEGLEPQHGDAVVSRHWQSRFVILMSLLVRITLIGNSSFANTDLDFQLRQRQITHVILAGLVPNTCLEFTARYAREL
jgi:nicotinamidase-related amidase